MSSTWQLHRQLLAAAAGALAILAQPASAAATLHGIDVSGYDPGINWTKVAAAGIHFAYVKATEGTTYRNPLFAQQYNGSFDAGLARGSYHFAHPNDSSGAAQADYFVKHGGGWSADGQTLPGVLDIEYNPSGSSCYGLSKTAMVTWIHDFADEYVAKTGRDVVIYTTADWWNTCTGSSKEFGGTNPMWVADYASKVVLPAGWSSYTFWQNTDSATVSGVADAVDESLFDGTLADLVAFANGTP